ncbi:MAG: LTA synthase family protein [Roseburia sp.]|nr:LTA synthase family protein [Roseburia sp.]
MKRKCAMLVLWGSLAGLLVYLEWVYHISSFGMWRSNPVYTLMLIGAWTAAEALIIGLLKGKAKKLCFYFFVWTAILWSCAQKVYLHIFKQPLMCEAIWKGGQDALTNYWREALLGVWQVLPVLIWMLLPGVLMAVWIQGKKWRLAAFDGIRVFRMILILGVCIAGSVTTMQVGKYVQADYYENLHEYFDPLTVAEEMGVLPLFWQTTMDSAAKLTGGLWNKLSGRELAGQRQRDRLTAVRGTAVEAEEGSESQASASPEASRGSREQASQEAVPDKPEKTSNGWDIDWGTLHALADNKQQIWLADYIERQEPTAVNEYTGAFEGYNLIYLTAEGFSPYAVREDLTPVLYRLIHSGFVFDNYYVPLWQTSTSDGEYINCTGLIPDGQFSMRESADNDMAFTLPRFFEKEGARCLAYHNNSLSYYGRYLTHNNLGYLFKGSALGKLSREEWGDAVFEMEHPEAWPASDLEMLQATTGDYIGQEPFHVYYMTVSGHMNYNFTGNAMSAKNREAVADLELSENARAYIACNIELDKALEYLLEELENAGILEHTVICLSADHYPYAMTSEQYRELAGRDLSGGMDLYRNNLILWNAAMEEPVHVTKACGSMDLVPTLLNLFGFDFDSRMYAGRDIFSDTEGLVIFNDRSFVSDGCIYKRKTKETIWLRDAEGNYLVPKEEQESYLERLKTEVKQRYQFSAYVLEEDYYADVRAALREG